MRNPEVVTLFLHRERGWAGPLTSTGDTLTSYGVVIGRWDVSGAGEPIVVVPDADRWYSVTTSRHRGILRRIATQLGIQLVEYPTVPQGGGRGKG